MDRDLIGALILIGIFVLMMTLEYQLQSVLQVFSSSKEFSTLVLLSGIAALYYKGYHKTAFVASLLVVYLLKTLWVNWPRSYASQLYVDLSRDKARFDPSTSIDLQFAEKTVTHNMPVLLVKPEFPELILFPPSSETLHDMTN